MGTIPWPLQPPQQEQAAGIDTVIKGLLSNLPSNTDMAKAAQAAATPIAGGHTGSVPASMTAPIPDWQNQPMNNRPVVGKHNAKVQGIGNAITGVLNAIGNVETAEGKKKQLQVATDTQTLLSSQQQIDQAKQVLQGDPNNAQAKALIDHNTQIMNGILADPKMRKAIGKGFSINWTDPEANNTDDHKGVAQGKEMAQKDFASQFEAAIPKAMTPNVQAQQQYQLLQQQQASTMKLVSDLRPLLQEQMRQEGANARLQTQQDRLDARQDAVNTFKATQDYLKHTYDMAKLQTEYALKLRNIDAEHRDRIGEIITRVTAAKQASEDVFDYKQGQTGAWETRMDSAQQKWSTAITSNANALTTLEAEIEKARTDGLERKNPGTWSNLLQTESYLKAQQQSIKQSADSFMEMRKASGKLNAGAFGASEEPEKGESDGNNANNPDFYLNSPGEENNPFNE